MENHQILDMGVVVMLVLKVLWVLLVVMVLELVHPALEKLKIYETCNFHVNLDLQDL